jgi:DNA-binding CsgD family transcriptional regulator
LVGFGGNVDFSSRGGQPAPTFPETLADLGAVWVLVLLGVAVLIVFIVLRFVSTGALIEGVKRARSNGSMTMREGFREGRAHWGVLLRVDLARQRAAVLRALAELEPREREIVNLRYGAELNAAEIAAQLGIEPANVRKILERLRVRIGERIESLVKAGGGPA